jgi:hypothetical protein
MKKIISLILLSSFAVATFGYTTTDVSQANYLASKRIIKDWSGEPKNYRFDDYIARSEIMGMVLAMMNITRNTHCRGDFADVPKSDTDWVCRTIETAADRWLINAKPAGMKTRPYGNITRAEALGILMKAYPDDGGWAGYGYYWGYNFPVDGQKWGYESAYDFSATWQASVFYAYIRKILEDTEQLKVAPHPNDRATRREVFDFAAKIDKKNARTVAPISWINCLNNLYTNDRQKYTLFETKFEEIFPHYSVYDAGAYCTLPNGNQIVSYSFFINKTASTWDDSRQIFVLFDSNNNYILKSNIIFCQPMGDVGYFKFTNTSSLNSIITTCTVGDAGHTASMTVELNGETLEIQ